jgi:hypothetical protein
VNAIVMRALAKSPAARFATMDDVVASLEPLAQAPTALGSSRDAIAFDRTAITEAPTAPEVPQAPEVPAASLTAVETREARRPGVRIVVLLGVLSVLVIVAFKVVGFPQLPQQQLVTKTPAPVNTAITDVPLPESPSPEARNAYAHALQLLRDGSNGEETQELERAIKLDPNLGAAYLRLVLYGRGVRGDRYNAIKERAEGLVSGMSARDRGLLEAVTEREGRSQKFEDLARRYPNDGEILLFWAYATRPVPDARTGRRPSSSKEKRITSPATSTRRFHSFVMRP